MHDFFAWIRCFVVRCSASRRSPWRCSPIFRSTKRIKLFAISSRPNNRNFPFISCPPIIQIRCDDKVLVVGRLSYLRHKWIEFISASGCLGPFLPFEELKRLQIEVLPFEHPVATLLQSVSDDGPVATLLRSVPDDGPQGRGYKDRGAVKRSSNSRAFEGSLDVAAHLPNSEKAAGFGTLRLLSVLSKAPCRLSLKEPRDQSYADRWCVRNKHAHERLV